VVPEQRGWYTDPFGRHEARWMSDGVPTKLVRDAERESYDEPPDSPPTHAWVPIEPLPGLLTSADTLRADAAEADAIPSLPELNKRESSAAITTGAHPWFLTRSWVRVPSAQRGSTRSARPFSAIRRAGLIAGGLVAGLILMLSSYLWVVQAVAAATARPPLWGGMVFDLVVAVAAPVGTRWMWRADRRARVPAVLRVQRAELAGGLFGLLSLFFFLILVFYS
jgi:hypothetical protein